MGFEKGNKLALGNSGQSKTFKTPEEFWEKFVEYKAYVDSNPWIKHDVVKSGENAGQLLQIPLQRPYTLTGFAVFLGFTYQGLLNYGKNESYYEFFEVYKKIENECFSHKFEGAAVGQFNATIIARDLGLAESQNINVDTKKDLSKLFEDAEKV